jgi:hypothetical protein
MKNENTKGCFAIIVALILIFIVLSVFMSVTDFIGKVLSYPIVYYGIPIALFIFLYYSNKKSNEENKKDEDKS